MNLAQKITTLCLVRQAGLSLLVFILFGLGITPRAEAVPKQIIILRHGEKQNDYRLCSIGQQRSLALEANYLGKGAANSLFPAGIGPDGIFAITLHTLELASPLAQSWSLPIQLYSVAPLPDMSKREFTLQLNQRTRQAARDLLKHPNWEGKTLVMVWEHDHIANRQLEEAFPHEKITLRQLLNLDKLPGTAQVPETWFDDNYDYFWIVDYGTQGSDVPTGFTVHKQLFPQPYQALPSNDWGKSEKLPKDSGCIH